MIGPNDSSLAINIPSLHSVRTVGSKKYPLKIIKKCYYLKAYTLTTKMFE